MALIGYARLHRRPEAGAPVREARAHITAGLKIGKAALYKALEGAGAQRSGEAARTGA